MEDKYEFYRRKARETDRTTIPPTSQFHCILSSLLFFFFFNAATTVYVVKRGKKKKKKERERERERDLNGIDVSHSTVSDSQRR